MLAGKERIHPPLGKARTTKQITKGHRGDGVDNLTPLQLLE